LTAAASPTSGGALEILEVESGGVRVLTRERKEEVGAIDNGA